MQVTPRAEPYQEHEAKHAAGAKQPSKYSCRGTALQLAYVRSGNAAKLCKLSLMRLGHTAKYAMQALAFLIRCHARDEWGQISRIARACQIPRKYLEPGAARSQKRRPGRKQKRAARRLSPEPRTARSAWRKPSLRCRANWCRYPRGWMIRANFTTEYGLRDVVQQARNAVQNVFDATSIEVLVCRPQGWLGNEF